MTFTTVDQTLLGPYQSGAVTFIGTGRNRLINGDMTFDQMNGGNVFNVNNVGYSLDQWFAQTSVGTISTQQQSATPPTGFLHYVRVTVTSPDASPAAGSQYLIRNGGPEGSFVRDFVWGTAAAKTVTMSFWVRSSLTGVFSFSFENSAHSRSYVSTYIINNANTWEFKSITVPGDTTGTWITDTSGFGMRCKWDLGSGSTYQTTPGSWQGAQFNAAIGATKLIATNGATWDMTGAQLEIGSFATPFEFRLYAQELSLCQRYYEKTYDIGQAPGTNTGSGTVYIPMAGANSSTIQYATIQFKVPKRTSPTMTGYTDTGTVGTWTVRDNGTLLGTGAPQFDQIAPTNTRIRITGITGSPITASSSSNWYTAFGHWTADCGF